MQFRKYFYRLSDGDSREIFFAEDNLVVLGRHVKPMFEGEFENFNLADFEFYRGEFETYLDSNLAFRAQCDALVAHGYFETWHTFASDSLKDDLTPKAGWQKALDNAVLAWADNHADDRLKTAVDALPDMPPEGEPLALYLRAYLANRMHAEDRASRAFAAKQAMDARVEAKLATYTWSMPQTYIRAEILTLVGEIELQKGDGKAALEALTRSRDLRPNHFTAYLLAWTIVTYFPQREEDGFDCIYPFLKYGDLDRSAMPEIVGRPAFRDYMARRLDLEKTGSYVHRWSSGGIPASDAAIAAAEGELGCTFPDDYRRFLRERGECDLIVLGPDETCELHFSGPGRLFEQRENIQDFIVMAESVDAAEEAFRAEYGVSLKHLVPVAAPTAASNCMFLHVQPGPKYGYCFTWNHDGPYELEYEHPSFSAYLGALTKGIDASEPGALDLFNIFVDEE